MAMKLNLKKLGETTGLGLLDVGLDKLDEEMGLEFPLNAQTIGRAGLFIVGLAANALTDKASDYTETMWIAEEPLVIRSIFRGAGVIADFQGAPSKDAIELRLRPAGQSIAPPMSTKVQFL